MAPPRVVLKRVRPAGRLFAPANRPGIPARATSPTARPTEARVSRYLNETMRRDPRVSRAVRPFARLENMAAKPAPKKGSIFDIFTRRPTAPRPRTEEEGELKPLSVQERIRDPEIVVGRERIHRNTIRQFKEMIFDERYGLNGTILQIAPQFPDLAGIIQDPRLFREFVQTQVKRPWATRLMALMSARPELRAATLLLYLQVVHKNDRGTRQILRASRRAA